MTYRLGRKVLFLWEGDQTAFQKKRDIIPPLVCFSDKTKQREIHQTTLSGQNIIYQYNFKVLCSYAQPVWTLGIDKEYET